MYIILENKIFTSNLYLLPRNHRDIKIPINKHVDLELQQYKLMLLPDIYQFHLHNQLNAIYNTKK